MTARQFHLFSGKSKSRQMLQVYRVNGISNKVERLSCANQSHLMQMVDQWGLQRVLHYSSPSGMQCAIYCLVSSDKEKVVEDMCLAVTTPSRNGHPDQMLFYFGRIPSDVIKVQDISHFVRQHYMTDSHQPLRSDCKDVQHTPNGGSLRTPGELGHWCDLGTGRSSFCMKRSPLWMP